jgi:hypothetical protein
VHVGHVVLDDSKNPTPIGGDTLVFTADEFTGLLHSVRQLEFLAYDGQ